MFPDPQNSAEYYLYRIDKLLAPPYALEMPTPNTLTMPNIIPPIHPSIQITRAKNDHFNILVPTTDAQGTQITKIQGLEILFEKDRSEELSSFKMPLMFVGVGVAFAY